MIPKKELINIPVTCLPFEEQIMLMLRWAKIRASKVVCLANVHMLMEAYRNPTFARVLQNASLVTPDGKPLVLMLRKLGIKNQNQVAGLDVFLNLCDLAEQTGIKVFFLGSTEEMLEKMKERLNREYPILQIAGMKAPPRMSVEEILSNRDAELIEEINRSGAGIVFVCLGCPKQEIWMSQYQGHVKGVMIGVGAVFSMYAGINPRAPYWIQQAGMEWLYRLLQEPKRLWRRYGSTIPPFLYLALKQLATPYRNNLTQTKVGKAKRNIVINLQALNYPHEKLGEILVRQNIISREDLQKALDHQESQDTLKLGEILVRQNFLSLTQLRFYLNEQNMTFADFLLKRKVISEGKLKDLLDLRNNLGKKIGELIIEQSILSEEQLKELLIEYYTRRKGLFLAEETANNSHISLWMQELLVN